MWIPRVGEWLRRLFRWEKTVRTPCVPSGRYLVHYQTSVAALIARHTRFFVLDRSSGSLRIASVASQPEVLRVYKRFAVRRPYIMSRYGWFPAVDHRAIEDFKRA